MNPHEMKTLQVRVTKLKEEIERLKQDQRVITMKMVAAQKELEQVETRLSEAKTNMEETRVSEHAMLRFCERAMGIDMKWVQEQILNENNRAIIRMAKGNCRIQAKEGIEFIVRDNCVVSVVA